MKKTLLSTAILFSILVNAQHQKAGIKKNNDGTQQVFSSIKTVEKTQAIIWSNDFSVPSTWTAVSNTPTLPWVIGTPPPAISNYSIPAINSTTHANGYAVFDSDQDCSGNEIADLTTSSSINCTGHPFVILKFEQQYRRYQDSTFIFISNDGTNWTKYAVNKDMEDTQYSFSNSQTIQLDISPTAGGQATVWVRFEFYSVPGMGDAVGCGYSWWIDDVAIYDMPVNDIKIDNGYGDFNYKNGGFYTMVPNSQIAPITFRAAVSNLGSAPLTNLALNVDISDGTNTVYSHKSAAVANFPYQGLDTLTVSTPPFVPAAQSKNYTVNYSFTQDQTELSPELLNSIQSRTIMVNDTSFARDNNIVSSSCTPNNYIGGDDGSELGNVYEFSSDAMANSISVFVHSNSSIGTSILGNIYKISPNGSFTPISTSSVHQISDASKKGLWVTLPISANLNKDSTYVASILTAGIDNVSTPKKRVYLGADKYTQQPTQTSYVNVTGGTSPGWGWVKILPMIRLNIKPTNIGIFELSGFEPANLGQNVPNPYKGESSIQYKLTKDASDAKFTITDVTGRIISSDKVSSNMGLHTIKLGAYAAGLYYYTLNVDGVSATKKMIVQ
jgi:hypothetical protein